MPEDLSTHDQRMSAARRIADVAIGLGATPTFHRSSLSPKRITVEIDGPRQLRAIVDLQPDAGERGAILVSWHLADGGRQGLQLADWLADPGQGHRINRSKATNLCRDIDEVLVRLNVGLHGARDGSVFERSVESHGPGNVSHNASRVSQDADGQPAQGEADASREAQLERVRLQARRAGALEMREKAQRLAYAWSEQAGLQPDIARDIGNLEPGDE